MLRTTLSLALLLAACTVGAPDAPLTIQTIPAPEVSGAVNIGEDRIMLIADEGYDVRIVSQAAMTFKAGDAKTFGSNMKPAIALLTLNTNKDILDDIEDVAWDEKEQEAFVITSHSLTRTGKVKAARYKLASLQFKNGTIEHVEVDVLKAELMKKFPFVAEAMKRPTSEGGATGAFNLEGLAFDPAKRALLLGSRSPTPLQNGKACAGVFTLNNPHGLFMKDKPALPEFEAQFTCLDLGGLGIRGMTYDFERKGFWIVAGRSDDPDVKTNPAPVPSAVWFWDSAQPNKPPRKAQIDTLGLSSLESICLLKRDGTPGLLLISDDGDEKENTVSRYLWAPIPRLSGSN